MTPKQKAIYEKLIEGKSYQQIADSLFISPETVKSHCRNIYRLHDVHNRKELMAYLLQKSGVGAVNSAKTYR